MKKKPAKVKACPHTLIEENPPAPLHQDGFMTVRCRSCGVKGWVSLSVIWEEPLPPKPRKRKAKR